MSPSYPCMAVRTSWLRNTAKHPILEDTRNCQSIIVLCGFIQSFRNSPWFRKRKSLPNFYQLHHDLQCFFKVTAVPAVLPHPQVSPSGACFSFPFARSKTHFACLGAAGRVIQLAFQLYLPSHLFSGILSAVISYLFPHH